MRLLYTTGHGLSGLHVLAPLVSWAIVIGALYGLIRLGIDLVGLMRRQHTAPERERAGEPEADPQQFGGGAVGLFTHDYSRGPGNQ